MLSDRLPLVLSDQPVPARVVVIRPRAHDDLSAFEGGAQSALCYAALEASTNILSTFGVEVIFEHIQALLDPLEQGLVARGFPFSHNAARRSTVLAPEAEQVGRSCWQ